MKVINSLFAPCLSALVISCCEYFLISVKLRVFIVLGLPGYQVAKSNCLCYTHAMGIIEIEKATGM